MIERRRGNLCLVDLATPALVELIRDALIGDGNHRADAEAASRAIMAAAR